LQVAGVVQTPDLDWSEPWSTQAGAVRTVRVGTGFDRGDQHGASVVVDLVEDAVGAASGSPGSVQDWAERSADVVRVSQVRILPGHRRGPLASAFRFGSPAVRRPGLPGRGDR
jgi:hypothetical protein